MPREAEKSSHEKNNALPTVMIVEDDVHIGAFLVEAITQETPYHALLLTNGDEALARRKNLKPGLLILDYHLPGINGLELYDQIHAIPQLTQDPAIMMSARLPRRERQQRTL